MGIFAIYVAESAGKAHRQSSWPDCELGIKAQGIQSSPLTLGGAGLQRQSVEFASHFALERFVDDLVLLDTRFTPE